LKWSRNDRQGSSAFEQKLLFTLLHPPTPPSYCWFSKKKPKQKNNVIFNPSLFIVSVLVKLTPYPPPPSTDIWTISWFPPFFFVSLEVPSPFIFWVQFHSFFFFVFLKVSYGKNHNFYPSPRPLTLLRPCCCI